MSDHGAPATVAPGVIVRLRIAGGGFAYTSKKLTLDEATDVADALRDRFRQFPDGLLDLPEFPSADLERLTIQVARVTSIEVRCVNLDGRLVGVVPDHRVEEDD